MASADTHSTTYFPGSGSKSGTHSLLDLIGEAVARLVRVVADADETRHALRRRRYAALLR